MIAKDVRRIALVVLVGALVVAVAGFLYWQGRSRTPDGNGGEATPSASPSASSTVEASGSTVAEATQKYLGADPPTSDVLATESGVIYAYSKDDYQSYEAPGTLEVLAVDVSEQSTHVRFRMKAESQTPVRIDNYIETSNPGFHTVRLIAEQADLSMTGATWLGENDAWSDCTCGRRPSEVGPDGVEISLLLPALPETVTEVQLQVPGFTALTAPVSRA
ncbi:hypothetical protein KIH74_27125 [Kineosporia sp. J2-2]|uniref:Secreted protein n=1 Tax=Kineosporia corallincola TaxID=2835133 RepID=A0ABS5TQQ0_9ACTN|nr:hypothetical protein [Kineosporia corallincola]MBT0772646.1 hypothetical protein [Kineosporia corallincola]